MTSNPSEGPVNAETPALPKMPWKGCFFSFIAIGAILFVLAALILPATRRAPQAAFRTECMNNIKTIALALHNYHGHYGALPPACTVDSDGKPLHSWRTLILPYLDAGPLYKSIDLSKPWNDPANAEAYMKVPRVYLCPSADSSNGYTTYLAVVGNHCCFNATKPRPFSEITDETKHTLMIVEVAQENAVPWMAPQDADEMMVLSLFKNREMTHEGGTTVAMADGSVHFFTENVAPQTLRAFMTISGNDHIGEF